MSIPRGNKIVVAVAIPIVIAIPFVVSAFPPPTWVKVWILAVTGACLVATVILRIRGRKGRI